METLTNGQVDIGPDSVITMTSPLLGSHLGWKGKYLFVARHGDIFLPVFLPFDKLRWEIDRPLSVVKEMQLYAAGEWMKIVRGEQGHIPAIHMIAELQRDAQVFYHTVVTTNRGLKDGNRGVSRVVSKGGSTSTWGKNVSPGGEQERTTGHNAGTEQGEDETVPREP